MSLTLTFWGTRGSIPSPGPHTVRYGGNTPCVELRTDDGALVILDAGTGIRELGRALLAHARGAIEADIFLTHTHWDHIQGLPFFAPLFRDGNRFTIRGSHSHSASVDRAVRDQMAPEVFPVSFAELRARIDFGDVGSDVGRRAGYEVSTHEVRHPGGALGYRFGAGGDSAGSLVYISDNELGSEARYPDPPRWRERLVEFVGGARVLVHDSMYTADEYRAFVGWGHSSIEQALELALDAEVERLVLFHHRPERTDDEVDRCVARCRAAVAQRGARLEVIAAAEGMTLNV
jgi:phosphoribosyl 1,2-cyclic phosphodiesterase